MELEYMDNTKNDHYYLDKIKTDLAFIVSHMKDVDAQELNDNEILLDSMLFRMLQISENFKKLSTEYRESENELPWNELIGLRNRIVHDYGNVDLNIVFETLKYDIPDLLERLEYINNNFLNELVIRDDGNSDNRKIENFTFIALEELLANAIVHNNYENGKPIQIYVSEKQINIVNYNKPLPPIRISDLNERTFFNERDTENPEIRDMFKALGIIESFGTGIGEAKRSMRENGSPDLFYKTFDVNDNVTSVVIPVNEEYYEIKNGSKPKKKVWIETETKDFKQKILDSGYTNKIKQNVLKLYEEIGTEVFGNSRVVEILGCSEVTATSYLKRMEDELKIIVPVEGMGKGKYKFSK